MAIYGQSLVAKFASTFDCSSMEYGEVLKCALLHSVLLYGKNNQLVATEVHDAEILTLEIFGLGFISVLKSKSNAERLFFDATQDGDLFAASFVRLEQAVAECLRTLKYPRAF